jgi:hypothetical protein
MSNRSVSQPLVEPLFIRIPPGGTQCPHCGLSRTTLDLLTRPQPANEYKPPVKSRLFRQTGTISKVRLIDYQSLKKYLNSMPDGSLEKEDLSSEPL